ncbi:hypothetical protein, conserved [Angomonas deanei]|uniref:Transmembrane protein 135 N-terminal domain-containing protein n=1 Tax=Angomonas deanei TaxID=59799 RepID=A0A7G2CRW2_9TRYP|nr:hypothetical protein, conserved [Angomonas deanei]
MEPGHHTQVDNVEDENNETQLYRKKLSARHTLKIVLRNGFYAAIGRILLGILKSLAKRGLSASFLKKIPDEFCSLNPLKWAVVFGGFSSFRLLTQILTALFKKLNIPKKVATFAAGCLCSLPVVVMNKETRTEMCLYMFVRAAHTFSLRYIFHRLPECMQRFDHYDTLLMCVSSIQIAYGCLFAAFSMPASYRSFLIKASMYDGRFMRGYVGYMRGHITPEMIDLAQEKGWRTLQGYNQDSVKLLCEYAHPGYTCNGWILHYIPQNMMHMGIPLYGPLKFVTMISMQRKKLLAQPRKTLLRAVKSVLTSALFLALYVSVFIRLSCFSIQMGFRGGLKTSVLCGLAGLPTLLEPKGRRMDLALYCSAYALRSLVLTQHQLGHIPFPRHWFVLSCYLSAMGFMFYEYEEEPRLLNSRVRTAFRLLLGEKNIKEHKHARPHHEERTEKKVV